MSGYQAVEVDKVTAVRNGIIPMLEQDDDPTAPIIISKLEAQMAELESKPPAQVVQLKAAKLQSRAPANRDTAHVPKPQSPMTYSDGMCVLARDLVAEIRAGIEDGNADYDMNAVITQVETRGDEVIAQLFMQTAFALQAGDTAKAQNLMDNILSRL